MFMKRCLKSCLKVRWTKWIKCIGVCVLLLFTEHTTYCTLLFSNHTILYHVPLAETPEQQHRGLSHRSDMGSGMLFVFSHPQRLSFWMHDTWIPLSIGFFDAQGVLLNIEDMTPNTDTIHFSASDQAITALELPQGQFAQLGLMPGTTLMLYQ